jgi:hypothetical protein
MQETPYPVTRKRASAPPQRQTVSRRSTYTDTSDDDDDLYDSPRMPTSSIRYDRHTDQAYTQRQLPAPKHAPRRLHWIVYVWLIVLCAIALVFISSVIANLWQRTADSLKYGYPRSYQTNADVEHGDSHHPISHFVAINDKGLIEVIEIPGDPSKAKPYLYVIAQVSGDHADEIPVTLTFTDVDGDGKIDMQVQVNGTTYTLYNDGSMFKIRN